MKKLLSIVTFILVTFMASASFITTGPDGGEYFITDGCVSCGSCQSVCPVEAIYEGDEHYEIDWEICVSCGACFDECPVGAIWYGSATKPR